MYRRSIINCSASINNLNLSVSTKVKGATNRNIFISDFVQGRAVIHRISNIVGIRNLNFLRIVEGCGLTLRVSASQSVCYALNNNLALANSELYIICALLGDDCRGCDVNIGVCKFDDVSAALKIIYSVGAVRSAIEESINLAVSAIKCIITGSALEGICTCCGTD